MKRRFAYGFAVIAALALCVFTLAGCSSRNMREELPGEWFVWHWYYNEDGGEDGFFDEAVFYTFGEDGTMTVADEEGEVSEEATYEFTSDDTLEVVYEDDTVDSFQLLPTDHDGVDQIQFMNENTKYTLTLEPISSWVE